MATHQIVFVFLVSCALAGWGALGLLRKEINVGSRSYTGGVTRISRDEEPVRFYFWCSFFIVFGLGGLLFLATD